MQDDDVSRYYRSITRYEALRIVADAAHLPLLIFFALFFAAGVYVGRWSVVLETRQRRKHLAEAVRGIVDGVLAGTSKTEGAVEDDGTATRDIIEGVLEGLRAGGAARAGGTGRASSSPCAWTTDPFESRSRGRRERSHGLDREEEGKGRANHGFVRRRAEPGAQERRGRGCRDEG